MVVIDQFVQVIYIVIEIWVIIFVVIWRGKENKELFVSNCLLVRLKWLIIFFLIIIFCVDCVFFVGSV